MQQVKVEKNDIYDYLDEYKNLNDKSLEDFLLDLTYQRPFGDLKFYVFSFLKHNMKGFEEKTLFHQPRLTKPEPTDSSMLFRLNPRRPGEVEVMWILPDIESINLFKKGKMFENELVNESIQDYLKNPWKLKKPEKDEVPEFLIKEVYKDKMKRELPKRQLI